MAQQLLESEHAGGFSTAPVSDDDRIEGELAYRGQSHIGWEQVTRSGLDQASLAGVRVFRLFNLLQDLAPHIGGYVAEVEFRSQRAPPSGLSGTRRNGRPFRAQFGVDGKPDGESGRGGSLPGSLRQAARDRPLHCLLTISSTEKNARSRHDQLSVGSGICNSNLTTDPRGGSNPGLDAGGLARGR